MIYIPSQNLLFVHIPKCGGWYVKTVLQTVFEDAVTLRDGRGNLMHAAPHKYQILDVVRSNKPRAFCFVRRPEEWVRSWWKYNTQRGWPTWNCGAQNPLVPRHHLAHSTFHGFVDKWLRWNAGGVTRMFDSYCNTPFPVEWYHSELIDQVLPEIIQSELPDISEHDHNRSSGSVSWDEEQLQQFLVSENDGISRYRYAV